MTKQIRGGGEFREGTRCLRVTLESTPESEAIETPGAHRIFDISEARRHLSVTLQAEKTNNNQKSLMNICFIE